MKRQIKAGLQRIDCDAGPCWFVSG